MLRRVKSELDDEGILYGKVDYSHPKLQQAVLDDAKTSVRSRSDVVSDDPTKTTQIFHTDYEYLNVEVEQKYNQINVCFGRVIETPNELIISDANGVDSLLGYKLTGFIVKERSENLYGFVLGKFKRFFIMKFELIFKQHLEMTTWKEQIQPWTTNVSLFISLQQFLIVFKSNWKHSHQILLKPPRNFLLNRPQDSVVKSEKS